MATKLLKVDLSLFKKLSDSLEKSVELADRIRTSTTGSKEDLQEYVLEMSKAIGFCASLSQESSMLMLDIMTILRQETSGASPEDTNAIFNSILGALKPPVDKGGSNKN